MVEAPKPVEVSQVVGDDKRLGSFCKRSFDQTFRSVGRDGFLFTGDIHDMWIRDSSAQVNQYLGMLHVSKYRHLVRSVIEKQTFYILFDAYANSYRSSFDKHPSESDRLLGRHGWVATRNFELDSGCYYFRLVYGYWKGVGKLLNVSDAVQRLVEVYEVEQYHETRSTYRYPELVRDGLGSKTGYTGMVWTGFRASDDACVYHYHIPDNVFLAVTLKYVMEMCYEWDDMELLDRVKRLRESVVNGLNRFGVKNGMYCYEVDGLGNCLMMDDANIPSLLSLPYLDPEQSVYRDQYYKKTKKFILSEKNPYYFKGVYSGIGSPHTPKNHIWHLSMIMQAMLDHDMNKVVEIMDTAGSSLHESFHVNDANRFTRHWFSWADSLFSEGWWCKEYVKPLEFSNVLWSRNYRSDSAIPEEYYESDTDFHTSEENISTWFSGSSGLIWLRMGAYPLKSDVYKFVTSVLDRLTSRFKLVTTDGDLSVPGSFDRSLVLRVLDHPLCDGWYTQNYDGSIVHEKLHAIPIGFDMHTYRTGLWSHTPLINWKHMLTLRSEPMERQDVVYIPSWSYDHPDRFRVEPQTRCLGSRRVSGKHKPLLDLWKDYKRYRYGFSTHGNGLDCHRTWEMLFYGMIPIVKTSSLDVLYRNLSVVVVSEWSEVCQEGVLVDKGLRGIQVFDKRYWLQ